MMQKETGRIKLTGKWLCGVCGNSISRNSLQCNPKCVHKECGQIMGKLQAANFTFFCGICMGQAINSCRNDDRLKTGSGINREKVENYIVTLSSAVAETA